VADQVAGVFPDRCVLSGIDTEQAVRLTATEFGGPRWLLGVPAFATVVGWLPGHQRCPVAVPVSLRVWKVWHARDVAALSTLAAGGTFVVIGGVTGAVGLAVFGLMVVIGAIAYRARAHRNYWFTCRLHPLDATIVIEPTHPSFDAAARDLFMRTLP
jgi:TctA family transporter